MRITSNDTFIRYKLSEREVQVLRMVAYEYTTKEIAKKLYISPHTVLSHRRNLLTKLNVKNAAGMVRKGFEMGFILAVGYDHGYKSSIEMFVN